VSENAVRLVGGPLDGWLWHGTDRAVVGYPAIRDMDENPEGEYLMTRGTASTADECRAHYDSGSPGLYRLNYETREYHWEPDA
jgi:hypothetical protein